MSLDVRARPRPSAVLHALDLLERAGNRLPNPVTMFIVMAATILAASAVAAGLDVSVRHPRSGETIRAVSLLTRDGVQRIFGECVKNFVTFAPLGTVLAAMIGIGVAERAGLIAALLRLVVVVTPRRLMTAAVVFAGMLSHLAADAGFVILPPLAGALFAVLGRHPLAGVAAAFAGVAGGFSANVLPSTLDVLLAGLTQESARLIDPRHEVQVVCNYYFLAASVPMLTALGAWVTTAIVEPRLGAWPGAAPAALERPDPAERRGLAAAGLTLLATLGLFALLVAPSWGPLRAEGATTLERIKPFLNSMVALILIAFLLPGLAFGAAAGRIRSDHDAVRMAGETMGTMGPYIVMAFAAAQFVKYFEWSNLGTILALAGASTLRSLHVEGAPLFLAFIALTMAFNLLIASASAKWTIMAPVFVPMFMLLGVSPEATQILYRVGDSVTNVITPLNPYFPLVLAFAQRYDPRIGIGTMVAMMIPYAVAFGLAWTVMVITWLTLGLPVGPGAGLQYSGAGI
jgi:aminobenzoyl-glutamate transport protein